MDPQNENTKSVGGKIPIDLFWKFKETYTKRRETATEALINAIQLYNDAETASEEEVK